MRSRQKEVRTRVRSLSKDSVLLQASARIYRNESELLEASSLEPLVSAINSWSVLRRWLQWSSEESGVITIVSYWGARPPSFSHSIARLSTSKSSKLAEHYCQAEQAHALSRVMWGLTSFRQHKGSETIPIEGWNSRQYFGTYLHLKHSPRSNGV